VFFFLFLSTKFSIYTKATEPMEGLVYIHWIAMNWILHAVPLTKEQSTRGANTAHACNISKRCQLTGLTVIATLAQKLPASHSHKSNSKS